MEECCLDVDAVIKPEPDEIFDVELEEDILEANRKLADENAKTLLKYGIRSFDIMGSVGSGKTSLIERLVQMLKGKYRVAAIGGDAATTIDAERIGKHGAKVLQINTGKECHLDANLVKKALTRLDLSNIDVLFIENVGNLICPADFPLGCEKRIVVISVSEGEHMVVKHPYIFAEADLAIINKIDLAPIMNVDPIKIEKDIHTIKPSLKVVKTSCKTGEGVEDVVKAIGL
ncbi:MAG: hydrogenase nickel incorporation protein HypB [Nitrososphaerales archaeon]